MGIQDILWRIWGHKKPAKKAQKSKKGFFRDQGILHCLLRITIQIPVNYI